jgi:hypothetical protein
MRIGRNCSVFVILLTIILASCGANYERKNAEIEIELTGEMLFEGANTLQYTVSEGSDEVAGISLETIKEVTVNGVTMVLEDEVKTITESLLLQIVSDNNELKTLGTLNPLPEGNSMELSMAEDALILPYLKDTGTTWVLDLNISEDQMEEMIVKGQISLSVEHSSNN